MVGGRGVVGVVCVCVLCVVINNKSGDVCVRRVVTIRKQYSIENILFSAVAFRDEMSELNRELSNEIAQKPLGKGGSLPLRLLTASDIAQWLDALSSSSDVTQQLDTSQLVTVTGTITRRRAQKCNVF